MNIAISSMTLITATIRVTGTASATRAQTLKGTVIGTPQRR
ncbi:hypothetical protein ACF1FX_22695 [Streptomyces sp. NPDC014646]